MDIGCSVECTDWTEEDGFDCGNMGYDHDTVIEDQLLFWSVDVMKTSPVWNMAVIELRFRSGSKAASILNSTHFRKNPALT